MSSKASTQPGRRTPLSLSGAATKTHLNKGGGNAVNSGGSNANGHTTSNTSKQDNKQPSKTDQQQTVNSSDIKENPNRKQQQADKKQQIDIIKKSNEKNQNGVNSNKQHANENKQQQNKDKQQQQNGNDNKASEKEKKENSEKPDKSDKLEKHQKENDEIKVKDDKKLDQDKPDIKKEDKKLKEIIEVKEDKKETVSKNDEKTKQQQSVNNDDNASKEENQTKNADQKSEEKVENMLVLDEQHLQEKSSVTPKSNNKANKITTSLNKTPNKVGEKTPQKSSPSNSAVKTTPVTKRVVTTTLDDNDDIEMAPLVMESSPIKKPETGDVGHINIAPSATSTPGKIFLPKRIATAPKLEVQMAMQTGLSPERPRVLSQISGRKSIHPISDYTPSKFQTNPQFRESYRRINTELDVTNTSMNVTVGSEVPNNLSFSFFGRGRKRERTPPHNSQSAIGELQTDIEVSPPKKARIDMHGFFSAVSSPLSLLRNRFSKATIQSSTPVKLQQKLDAAEDEIEVQNVSGVSVHEEIAKTDKEPAETGNSDNDATLGKETKETMMQAEIVSPTSDQDDSADKEFANVSLKCEKTCGMGQTYEQSDIKITETPLKPIVGDPMAKNKRCVVM